MVMVRMEKNTFDGDAGGLGGLDDADSFDKTRSFDGAC